MTDTDYPPTRTVTLGDAREAAADRVDTADDEAAAQRAANERDALAWAVDTFGGDADVTFEAYTATTRARVLDCLRTEVMGQPGPEETQVWLVAAGIDTAPWLDDSDIAAKATATGQLPPPLVDWANRQLDDLNDLTAGN